MENTKNLENKIKNTAKEHFLMMGLSERETLELIEEGINAVKSKLNLISTFLKKKDIEELKNVIHALKGILLNLGMKKEGEIFKQLKEEIKNKNILDAETEKKIKEAVKELLK